MSAATSGRIITYSTRESDTSQVLDGCLAVETALGPAAMAGKPGRFPRLRVCSKMRLWNRHPDCD